MNNEMKEIVNNYIDLIIPLNISDNELYSNYNELYRKNADLTNEEMLEYLKKDVLYNFTYNTDQIFYEIEQAKNNFNEESIEYNNILKMEEILKKFNFKISN